MGDKSAIEWTDATWNPITGCSKVSPGCAHCYAETLALTRMRGREGYPGLPWTPENAPQNVTLRRERLDRPLRWQRPRRIFVNSLSDLFHELVPEDFIAEVFAVMALSRRHTFQVLTKRPETMRSLVGSTEFHYDVADAATRIIGNTPTALSRRRLDTTGWRPEPRQARAGNLWIPPWPLPNVWLGTSVENQHWADVRIPELLATPAAVRFLSMEPLLGPVDISPWLRRRCDTCNGRGAFPTDDGRDPWGIHCLSCGGEGLIRALHWIIAGGESGPNHRPIDLDWVRSIRDQCQAADVPFLSKQVGGRTSKSGGRELDGRTWDEYPQVAANG